MKCERCGEVNPAEIHTCTPEPQVNGWFLYSGLPKLMKPTQEQVIAWAWEAGNTRINDYYTNGTVTAFSDEQLKTAYTLAYEAGRKDENEACAKVCMEDASLMRGGTPPQIALIEAAAAIRARREQ